MSINLSKFLTNTTNYSEIRRHENFQNDITMIDGNVTNNSKSNLGGVCSRVYIDGAWGFSSSSDINSDSIAKCLNWATENAKFLSSKSKKDKFGLGKNTFEVEKDLRTKQTKWSQNQRINFLQEIDNYITKTYPNLSSRQFALKSLDFEKTIATSDFSSGYTYLPRTHLYVQLFQESGGSTFSHREIWGGLGEIEDVAKEPKEYFADIDKAYKILQDKTSAVPTKAGFFDVILGNKITGILAHEAVGHPLEADLIKMGSVAGQYYNERVGSDKVSMVDFANTAFGEICPVPVYIDDEGTKAVDAPLISKGQLTSYMNDRENAHYFDHTPTGSARAFAYNDEPLVRMRNTAILPGTDSLDDMISSIEDGYYFINTGNGQADLTTEFMFGVTAGYEIKNGKIVKPVLDTTISGLALDVMGSVDMVGSDFNWESSGFCGKKQRMSVSFGGPSLKCKIKVGGK